MARVPTVYDLIRSRNPGPSRGSNWAKMSDKNGTINVTPTNTRATTPSRTPTSTYTRSQTPTVTFTKTPQVTHTRTVSPTNTATRTRTYTAFVSPTVCYSPTSTPTSTSTLTATPTSTLTATQTRTITPSSYPTPTQTSTQTRTITPSSYSTPSPTLTATQTRTITPSSYPTPSPTQYYYCQCFRDFINTTNYEFCRLGVNSVTSITTSNSFTYNYIDCAGGDVNTNSWFYPCRNVIDVSGVRYAACWSCLVDVQGFTNVTCCGNPYFYNNSTCTMQTEWSNFIMITDRHFIALAHNTPHINSPQSDPQYNGLTTGYCINFIKPDGSRINNSIACWATNDAGLQGCYFSQTSVLDQKYFDVAIGKLAAPITDPDIKIYKFGEFKNLNGSESVPSASFPIIVGGGRSFTGCPDNGYAIALNSTINPWECRNTQPNSYNFYINSYQNLCTASNLLPDRTLYFPSGISSGDSGNPIFAVYNNELLLMSMIYNTNGGPLFGQTAFLDEVQNVIDSQLGADGTIERVNLWSDIS